MHALRAMPRLRRLKERQTLSEASRAGVKQFSAVLLRERLRIPAT
jgi:hypothetical protein